MANNTPGFRSGFHDDAAVSIGRTYETDHPAMQRSVIRHDAAANVLSGCVIALEGCNDPLAANYDPIATFNSMSWCVPVIQGCMMPATLNYTSPAAHGGLSVSRESGLSLDFDVTATVHSERLCTGSRTNPLLVLGTAMLGVSPRSRLVSYGCP